ncbi:MAG: type II secretion system protein [Planctomycetota bacterium]|nr:type II secretion system protein [Planctomycetota bacterium]
MSANPSPARARAFTLIELLVAISVSVVLLSIMAFVFRISTAATRDANARVALTERLRSLNIRMRQELGGMLPIQRLDPGSGIPPKPYTDKRTFELSDDKRILKFASATVEGGRPVSVDVKYEYLPDPSGDVTKNVLIRWRDKTGPFNNKTHQVNDNYLLGDDQWEVPDAPDRYYESDVMVKNVRLAEFEVVDVPDGMPGNPNPPSPTELSPRELPSMVKLTIEFGPESGNINMVERAILCFPIYRGL